MTQLETLSVPSHPDVLPHEKLDVYWFARMLRHRAVRVAADAKTKSTIGRALESALGRVIRLIIDAANGRPEKADERLERARAAISVALDRVADLLEHRRVRQVVAADLRDRGLRLYKRLETLEGKPVEAWPSENRLETVLDEVRSDAPGAPQVDVIAAVVKLPDAALRDLPRPVVPDVILPVPQPREVVATELVADNGNEPAPRAPTKGVGGGSG